MPCTTGRKLPFACRDTTNTTTNEASIKAKKPKPDLGYKLKVQEIAYNRLKEIRSSNGGKKKRGDVQIVVDEYSSTIFSKMTSYRMLVYRSNREARGLPAFYNNNDDDDDDSLEEETNEIEEESNFHYFHYNYKANSGSANIKTNILDVDNQTPPMELGAVFKLKTANGIGKGIFNLSLRHFANGAKKSTDPKGGEQDILLDFPTSITL